MPYMNQLFLKVNDAADNMQFLPTQYIKNDITELDEYMCNIFQMQILQTNHNTDRTYSAATVTTHTCTHTSI